MANIISLPDEYLEEVDHELWALVEKEGLGLELLDNKVFALGVKARWSTFRGKKPPSPAELAEKIYQLWGSLTAPREVINLFGGEMPHPDSAWRGKEPL